MAQDDGKNLQKYFEDDPPSFFDDLAVKGSWEERGRGEFDEFSTFSDESIKVSSEVRDLWPYPDKSERFTPTVPCVTTESLVRSSNHPQTSFRKPPNSSRTTR
jgi:hypothetical protein